MGIFAEIINNKLLLYSIIAVVFFIIISIILIKKVTNEKDEEVKVDIQKIDGENSIFDEIIEEKEKSNGKQLDLDSMIAKMQQDLDAKASEVVEKFENEQEEKSVISYQELIGNKKEEINPIDVTEIISEEEPSDSILEDKYTEPINIQENIGENTSSILEKLNILENNIKNEVTMESVETEKEQVVLPTKLNMKDDFVEAIKTGNYEEISNQLEDVEVKPINEEKEQNKFKATEFISPIYGVQDIKIQYPTVQNIKDFKEKINKYNKFELDNTLNMQKVDSEIHKDEDFLNSLKEFRKNLE